MATASARSRRTTTSVTGRSPTLATVPRTVTIESTVVTVWGLTSSMTTLRNCPSR
ncbi:Uncharacterised protein [Mycobacteroides abscessus subsp. abscessus]|nr:Uncharacterised protein [Mycobacteroides abscessus subsp. abscessus]